MVQQSTGALPTGVHSTLAPSIPQNIQPPNGFPPKPAESSGVTEIQIGFGYGLNYPFVVRTRESANQIFKYLPQGIAYGLGIDESMVVMQALQPYNTVKETGYITTVALAWVPNEMVNPLALDVHTAVSRLYNNPNPSVHTLMSMINPAIPILPGGQLPSSGNPDGVLVPQSSSPTPSGGSGSPNGAPLGDNSSSGGKVQASSVGIGVGVVAGAAVYGAAMFFVARRYKKRRAAHRRASSLLDGFPEPDPQGYNDDGSNPEMSVYAGASPFGYGTVMSGGRGGANPAQRESAGSGSSRGVSIRSAGISAPLMSENSLGWN